MTGPSKITQGDGKRFQLEGDLTMVNQLELLEREALKLSSGERAAFARLLLSSLDEENEIDEAWSDEMERRIAQVEEGDIECISVAAAISDLRATLQ
jgi:putative addiction module component (TIGR02574 family)